VTRRHQRQQRLTDQPLAAQVGALLGHPDHGQVELPVVDEALELAGDVLLQEAHLHLRVLAGELGQHRGQQPRADAGQHPERHPSPGQPAHLGHALPGLLGFEDGPAGVRQERLTRGRHPDPPAEALEQRRAQFLLQLADLHRQRRLRQVQPFGGLGEAALLGHRDHVTKLVQFHRRLLSACFEPVPAASRPMIAGRWANQ
jgi:hypothetical protein